MEKARLGKTDNAQLPNADVDPASMEQQGLLPRTLFLNLREIAKSIVDIFGRSQCEVVIHDLADLEHSIVWIEGNVTGRHVGGSLTNLGIRKVQSGDTHDLLNYETMAPDGRKLKSSSIFIRNERGEAIGAFCINLDISALVTAEQILRNLTLTTNDEAIEETFIDDVPALLETMICECAIELGKPISLMNRVDKVELVKALEQKGAFQLRQAVPIVADCLGVSRQTIYNYLNEETYEDD